MDTYAIVASVLLQVITGFLGSSHPPELLEWEILSLPVPCAFCRRTMPYCCFHLVNTRFYGSVPEPDDTDERPPAECLCAEVKIRTN